ncbi:MAG: universal stress protein [Deltaproteobacteria bacterium]|nr:universal stress protein [Deltaproteobacteria bacterium]
MGKRILVAFDDSENAMRAVEYIADSFKPENEIILFSVIPDTATLGGMFDPEFTYYSSSYQEALSEVGEKKKASLEKALQKAKEVLLEAGFEEKNVIIKANIKKVGVARDIINEARSGYDAVVMGRKGISGIKEFFIGSVAQKVLHSVKDVSVLIVD